MVEGVVNSNPTFQAADIWTRKKPQWDELCDKMKYVMTELIPGQGEFHDGYMVYAYSKVPMRKKAWQTLFHKKAEILAIKGKFEDYIPYQEAKLRLSPAGRVKEWGVCPSLRARPNMTAQKQAVAEAEQMAEQISRENRLLRKENQQLKAELSALRSHKMTSGSKRKAAEIGADESEAEEAVEGETTI
jgi:hypothetical protein